MPIESETLIIIPEENYTKNKQLFSGTESSLAILIFKNSKLSKIILREKAMSVQDFRKHLQSTTYVSTLSLFSNKSSLQLLTACSNLKTTFLVHKKHKESDSLFIKKYGKKMAKLDGDKTTSIEGVYQVLDLYKGSQSSKDTSSWLSKKYFDNILKQARTCVSKLEKRSTDKIEPSDKPILTIIIPAYNVELFLENSVLSLIDHELVNQIEILIINDGSLDKTKQIAEKLESTCSRVKLINKTNGGHGSTINLGIELATGKYIKIMDGDDYFSTKELVKLIKILQTSENDIILTDYVEDFAENNTQNNPPLYDKLKPNEEYFINERPAESLFHTKGPLLATTTAKRSIFKKMPFKLSEKCFYVDMEFNFLTYALSKTLSYCPLSVYNYFIGRTDQSMHKKSLVKNRLNHEAVILNLIDQYYKLLPDLSTRKAEYLKNFILVPMCWDHYKILTELIQSSQTFLDFESKLKKFPEIYNDPKISGKIIKMHRKLKGRTLPLNNLLRKTSEYLLD